MGYIDEAEVDEPTIGRQKISIVAIVVSPNDFSFWIFEREDFYHVMRATWRILDEDSYFKQYTSPLSLDVARDLCEEFELPTLDWRCQGEKVYGVDFYPAIIDYYSNISAEDRTLDAVQSKIGNYQTNVETKGKDKDYSYWYSYDFTGDQMFPLIIIFNENGIMVDIVSDAGRDS